MTDIRIIENQPCTFDILIGCIGYEKRSTYVLKNTKDVSIEQRIFFDYSSTNILSYDANFALASEIADVIEPDFNILIGTLQERLRANPNSKILIDITSLDRVKMARLMSVLFQEYSEIDTISICYSPSKFQEPKSQFDVVNSFGPVIPELIGNNVYGRENLALIVGAGYEYGRVVGAIDTLEPTRIHCFTPTGTDPKFDPAIMKANLDFNFLEQKDALFSYDVGDTFALYYNLRRIIEQDNSTFNVMILPLGPKIFACISIIIAIILHPNIMVWRHSTADPNRPDSINDAEASGMNVSFSFEFVS